MTAAVTSFCGVALVVTTLLTCSCTAPRAPHGPLIIVGGGGTPRAAIEHGVGLANGRPVVILPQASRREDAGHSSARMFIDAGASSAEVLELSERTLSEDRQKLVAAGLIWFPGGSQNRLMASLEKSNLIGLIRQLHRGGTAAGGTSAGAAVMSRKMITGNADLKSVQRDATELGSGLGLVSGVIIDQHFHRRQRFNRLLSAVISNPGNVGIGIDERTAIILRGNRFQVVGESSVLVIEGGHATLPLDGEVLSAQDYRLSVLTSGMSHRLKSPGAQ